MKTGILILIKAFLTYILIDIINGQINPDDFLDWEGDFSKAVKFEERIDCSDFGHVYGLNSSLCW